MTTKIAIAGAKGRMGQNLIESGLSNKETKVVGVFDISEDFYNLGESLVEQAVEVYTDKIERGMNELHNYIVRDTL